MLVLVTLREKTGCQQTTTTIENFVIDTIAHSIVLHSVQILLLISVTDIARR